MVRIEEYKQPQIDSSTLKNIGPLEIVSTVDEISNELKEQTKLLNEILKEIKTK